MGALILRKNYVGHPSKPHSSRSFLQRRSKLTRIFLPLAVHQLPHRFFTITFPPLTYSPAAKQKLHFFKVSITVIDFSFNTK